MSVVVTHRPGVHRRRRTRAAGLPSLLIAISAAGVAGCQQAAPPAGPQTATTQANPPAAATPATPPADARAFWRFGPPNQVAYFYRQSDGRWREMGDDRGAEMGMWDEVARTPEFVEMYDPKRNYSIRLGAGRSWLASGRGNVIFGPSLAGDWEGTRRPTLPGTPTDTRVFWRLTPENGSGYLKRLDNGKWQEIGRNGEEMGVWDEVTRTPEYVEIQDPKRNFTGRLGAGRSWHANGRGPNATFSPAYAGDWEGKASPQASNFEQARKPNPAPARSGDNDPRTVEQLVASLPENAQLRANDDTVRRARLAEWMRENAVGKRIEGRRVIQEVGVHQAGNKSFAAHMADAGHSITIGKTVWNARLTNSSEWHHHQLTFVRLDDPSADKLYGLKGQTVTVSGTVTSMEFYDHTTWKISLSDIIVNGIRLQSPGN